MNIWTCSIHDVEFGCQAPLNAPPDVAAACRLVQCQVCLRTELVQLREQRDKLLAQRDALLAAIEIKREHLVTKL